MCNGIILKCGCVSAHPQNVSAPSLSHCLNSAALIRTGLSNRVRECVYMCVCVCVCVCVRVCVHGPKCE